ncbi:MAG: PAS domain S-box protein [Desulfovibrionaceae bacterium]|nr:PAS domain S-box protein [Desulfovibrionaceae bacterium]MBF0514961.1 PAS domain S-box protein [Desulfovibrionaceae bacterium]
MRKPFFPDRNGSGKFLHFPAPGNITGSLYLLVACAIFPALLIILYSGLSERDRAIENTSRILENFTNGVADIQVEKANQIKLFLQTIAILPEVKSLDRAGCVRLFEELLRDNPGLANITLTDTRGIVLASGLPSAERVDLSDRTGFKDAVRTRAFSSGEFTVGRYVKAPVFPFSLPVFADDGSLAGVLLCSHVLEKYQDYFTDIKLMPDSRLSFLDRNGVRLLGFSWHGETPPVGTPVIAQNWRVISESQGDAGHFTGMRYDGTSVLFHFRKLRLKPGETPYMTVFMNTPVSVILAPANRALRNNLALLALAALMAFAVARLLGRALVARRFEALKESQDRLRASEQRLLDAQRVALVGDWEIVPATGRITWSGEVCRIAGREPGALPDSLPETLSLFHPQDGPLHDLAVREALALAKPYSLELRVLRPDGHAVHVRVRGHAEQGANGEVVRLYGTIQDISERKLAEEALRRSETRYRTLFERSLDAIAVKESFPPRFKFVNPAFTELSGYTVKELRALGENAYWPLVHPDDLDRVRSLLKDRYDGKIPAGRYEMRLVRKDGAIRWTDVSATRIENDGVPAHLTFYHDITEQKQNEELRGQIERIVRHDLRVPASNAIGIAGSLLADANLTPQQRRLLALFENAGQNMLDTLDSSLDMYKIETGQYRCEPVAFDCLSLVREIIEVMAITDQFAGVRLELLMDGQPARSIRPETRRPCLGEPRLLRMALQNLLVNALEASPGGGQVVVALSSDANCRIEIRNRGAVASEIRDRFFEKYVTRGKAKGTGLGAYSAMMMVRAQGGAIAMRASDEDDETVVTVTMPC